MKRSVVPVMLLLASTLAGCDAATAPTAPASTQAAVALPPDVLLSLQAESGDIGRRVLPTLEDRSLARAIGGALDGVNTALGAANGSAMAIASAALSRAVGGDGAASDVDVELVREFSLRLTGVLSQYGVSGDGAMPRSAQ